VVRGTERECLVKRKGESGNGWGNSRSGLEKPEKETEEKNRYKRVGKLSSTGTTGQRRTRDKYAVCFLPMPLMNSNWREIRRGGKRKACFHLERIREVSWEKQSTNKIRSRHKESGRRKMVESGINRSVSIVGFAPEKGKQILVKTQKKR